MLKPNRCEAGADLLREVGDLAVCRACLGGSVPALEAGKVFLPSTWTRGHPCSFSVRINPVAFELSTVILNLMAQLSFDLGSIYAPISWIVIWRGGQRRTVGSSFWPILACSGIAPMSSPSVAGSHEPMSLLGWQLLRGKPSRFHFAAGLGDGPYQGNFLPIDNLCAEYHDDVICAEGQSGFDWVSTCFGKVCCKYDSIESTCSPPRGEVRFIPSRHLNTCLWISVLGVPLGG